MNLDFINVQVIQNRYRYMFHANDSMLFIKKEIKDKRKENRKDGFDRCDDIIT